MSVAPLERLAELLAEEGGLLAAALLPAGPSVLPGDPGYGALAASGPLAQDAADVVAIAVEAAFEGLLLHRGRSRLIDAGDADLALLAGDRLFALSLATLASAGRTDDVRELAEAIALSARAQAEHAPELEQAAWEAAATAIGWGADERLRAAKEAAGEGGEAAVAELREAGGAARGDLEPAR